MAEVVITTRVNNELVEKSINNFKDLKREIRASKDELLKYAEGSEDFKRVQQNVSKLQTSLKDLGDTARIQGSGVERLTQSFNLLGDAFTSGDIEKGKIAMTGLGQAMSAIPIFLLIQGFTTLIQNFDSLRKSIPFIDEIGKAFEVVVNVVKQFTDDIGLTNFQLNETIKKSKELAEIQNKQVLALYDNSIKLAKAQGKETTDLEIERLNAFIKINQARFEEIRKTGFKEKEEAAKISQDIANARVDILAIEATKEKELNDVKKKDYEEYIKEKEKQDKIDLKNTLDKLSLEERIFYQKQGEELKREAEKAALLEKQRLDAENAYLEKQKDLDKQFAALEKEQKDAAVQDEINRNKKLVEDKIKSENAKKQAVQVGFNAAQLLSQAFFQGQLNQSKGNAEAELKIRKQMFEVDKAFNIARAIQDGIRSVQAALTIPPPGGQILAVANGALAAANVAKIAATKFDGGSVSSSSSSVSTTLPEAPTQTAPTLPQFGESGSTQLQGGNGTINQTNQPLTVRAIVVESDITNTQNTVNKERRTATFG